MNSHDVPLSFNPLPPTSERRFVWNSGEWWKWFRSYRRKPAVESIHARLREYDSFVSFHCARPTDVSSFYKSGLRLGDIESLNRHAREILISPEYPWITPERFERATADASGIHDKTLFAVIDEREISGHYLIYGSEHICGIAASISREVGFDCRDILKYHGTPTVFRMAIPRELIPDSQLHDLAEHVMEMYWDERKRERPPRVDWSWILKQGIPGRHVLDHVHPEKIPDPTMQYIPYRYRDNWPCLI